MDILSAKFNFNSLSIKDLVEARDLFHVHLINKQNVIATAVGRYRIRNSDPWPNETGYTKSLSPTTKKTKRTLQNSEVREYSWPCILVFVSEWREREELSQAGQDDIVPRCIYLPDGRVVPICVIEAPPSYEHDESVNSNVYFPQSYISGGFPLLVNSQGVDRIASVGCVVKDGNKYYALTNQHICGKPGTEIYTRMKGSLERIGISSDKQLGKVQFEEVYDGWNGKKIFINNDVGLIEIDDRTKWKTEIYGIGEMQRIADLNTSNFSLSLIAVKKPDLKSSFPKLCAFGAVSGKMEGEIIALFYRYKSLGGLEYVSDFLIGGVNGTPLNTHFGDSGTTWLLKEGDANETKYYPIALHWGQHTVLSSAGEQAYAYALATNLTTVCSRLDVDIVRGWNLDNEYSWGITGHYKIAAKACELVSNTKLSKFLMANQKNIGYVDDDLINHNVVSGKYSDSADKFVPLADVPDIIWRATRKPDESNHFADVDESDPRVENGRTLIEICSQNSDKIDIDYWIQYFEAWDKIKPNERGPREGALPFRVWQMYNQMIKSLKAKNLEEFLVAGGTMSHYVGDASQALHISWMHHGRTAEEHDVHSDYETKLIDKKKAELFKGVNKKAKKVTDNQIISGEGKEAAKRVFKLMSKTIKNLPPSDICDSYTANKGVRGKFDNMWEDVGTRTIDNIADGCNVMAILWQSAWIAGGGDSIAQSALKELNQDKLKKLYDTYTFVQSFNMKNPKFKDALT